MTNNNDFLDSISVTFNNKTHIPILNLAYIGDAVFEVMVRSVILEETEASPDKLHKTAKKYVSATAQSKMYHKLIGVLSEEELDIMKQGRNAKNYSKAKNASIIDYRHATGVEALFGYLYINNNSKRLSELFNICFTK